MSEEGTTTTESSADTGETGGTESALSWLGEAPSEDVAGYVTNKGWKDPGAVVESYRNLETKFGADRAGRTVVLPADDASDTEKAEFYTRLGRPESPEQYEVAAPEGDDGSFAKWAKEQFFNNGLNATQAKTLTEGYTEFARAAAEKQRESYRMQVEADLTALKSEWGAAYDQKVAGAKNAAKALGLKAEVIDKIEEAAGFGDLMRFMDTVASKIGEDEFVSDGDSTATGQLTPEDARAQLRALQHDKDFTDAWLNKRHPKHEEAVAKKSRLAALAVGQAA